MGFQNVSDLSKILFLFLLPTPPFALWRDPLGRLKMKSTSLPKSFPFHHLHFHLCSYEAPGAHCCWHSFLLSKRTLFDWDYEWMKSASHQFFWVWFAGRIFFLRGWVCLLAGDISSAFIFCYCEFGLEASPSSWQLLAACCKNMIN